MVFQNEFSAAEKRMCIGFAQRVRLARAGVCVACTGAVLGLVVCFQIGVDRVGVVMVDERTAECEGEVGGVVETRNGPVVVEERGKVEKVACFGGDGGADVVHGSTSSELASCEQERERRAKVFKRD